MDDNLKSGLFAIAGAVVLLATWAASPRTANVEGTVQKNKPLFEKPFDPRSATSLEILQFDESTGTAKPFKVAMNKDRWSIPSHSNYPADAKEHMADAATSMLDLVAIDVAGVTPGDHELYGVFDPEGAKAGATGVGMRVVMKKGEEQLIGVIIGKEVPDRKDYRYVRVIGQDPTYVVKVSTDKLSTKFEDWIEKDLLKLNTFDVKTVTIDDYSIDELQGALIPRNKMTLDYNDSGEPKWKLLEDLAVQGQGLAPQKMADDEELNAKKLDDMKFALGDLKIVDVAKKPDGLSGQLRAKGEIKANRETTASLGARGFHFARVDNELALYSTEGEAHVHMKDGVKYVLRFGRITGKGSDAAKKDEGKKDAKKDGDKKDGDKKDDEKSATAGLNRYIFVMAEFDPSNIEKPKLEPLPPEPKPEAKPEAKKDDAKKDGKKEEAKKEESKPDPKAERKRIEDENKKNEEEYKKKLADGKKRADELNARFADWYYVINDDVYQKIHLGRKEVVQKKEKKEEAKKDEHEGHDHGAAKDSPAEFKDLSKEVPAAKPGAGTEKKPEVKPAPGPAPGPQKPDAKPAAAPTKAEPAKPAPAPPPEKKPEAAKPAVPPAPKPDASKPAPAPTPEKKPEPAKK